MMLELLHSYYDVLSCFDKYITNSSNVLYYYFTISMILMFCCAYECFKEDDLEPLFPLAGVCIIAPLFLYLLAGLFMLILPFTIILLLPIGFAFICHLYVDKKKARSKPSLLK